MLPVQSAPYDARVRRLIILVCALVTCDLMLWSAVVPLVPYYRHELGLSTIQVAWMLAAFSLAVWSRSRCPSATWPTGSAPGS